MRILIVLLLLAPTPLLAQSNDEIKAAMEICFQNRQRLVGGVPTWPEGYENCKTVWEKYSQNWKAEDAQKKQAEKNLINKIK